MAGIVNHQKRNGFTVLEVIVAIFIFGCISAALFKLIAQSERIRGRALFVESAARFAADEAERLRNIAINNEVFEDSSFTESAGGRTFLVQRKIVESADLVSAFLPKRLEPLEIEITVSDAIDAGIKPLHFKLLMGSDRP